MKLSALLTFVFALPSVLAVALPQAAEAAGVPESTNNRDWWAIKHETLDGLVNEAKMGDLGSFASTVVNSASRAYPAFNWVMLRMQCPTDDLLSVTPRRGTLVIDRSYTYGDIDYLLGWFAAGNMTAPVTEDGNHRCDAALSGYIVSDKIENGIRRIVFE